MDDIDRITEQNEILERAMVSLRKHELPDKGSCYNCDERLPVGKYCDADCRIDHEKEQYARSQRPHY